MEIFLLQETRRRGGPDSARSDQVSWEIWDVDDGVKTLKRETSEATKTSETTGTRETTDANEPVNRWTKQN